MKDCVVSIRLDTEAFWVDEEATKSWWTPPLLAIKTKPGWNEKSGLLNWRQTSDILG